MEIIYLIASNTTLYSFKNAHRYIMSTREK